MSDDRLEDELRSLLRADAPASAPASLRARASRVPLDEAAQQRDLRRHGPMLAGAVGVVALAAVLVVAVVLGVPRPGPVSGSPVPGVPATEQPTATPARGATPSPSGNPTPAPQPTARVWSFTARDAGDAVAVRAADGTAYLATSPWGPTGQADVYALDATGGVKPGWPFAPAGIAALGTPAVAPDGTVYVVGWALGKPAPASAGSNAAWLWALDPAGQVRPGWPYAVQGSLDGGAGLAIRPDGAVVVAESRSQPGGGPAYDAVAVGPDGRVLAGWPVGLPGPLACTAPPCTVTAVGADGTWYAMPLLGDGPSAQVVALRADGSATPGWPVAVGGGEGLALGPAGTVYAWGADVAGTAGTSPGPRVVRTRFLALGPDGSPRPGWPVTIDGPAGIPSFAPDGTLYTTTGSEAEQPERVLALGTDGSERQGWPYTLPVDVVAVPYAPSGGMPPRATSPSVGPGGAVYLPVDNAGRLSGQGLLALSADGQVASGGWPAWLPDSGAFEIDGGFSTGGGQPIPPAFGADGTVFIAARLIGQGAIVALDQAGHQRPGSPYSLGGSDSNQARAVGQFASGGRLYVTAQIDGGATTILFSFPQDAAAAPR